MAKVWKRLKQQALQIPVWYTKVSMLEVNMEMPEFDLSLREHLDRIHGSFRLNDTFFVDPARDTSQTAITVMQVLKARPPGYGRFVVNFDYSRLRLDYPIEQAREEGKDLLASILEKKFGIKPRMLTAEEAFGNSVNTGENDGNLERTGKLG